MDSERETNDGPMRKRRMPDARVGDEKSKTTALQMQGRWFAVLWMAPERCVSGGHV